MDSVRVIPARASASSTRNSTALARWSGVAGYPGAGRTPWYRSAMRSSLVSVSSAAYPQSSRRTRSCSRSAMASARRSASALVMIEP